MTNDVQHWSFSKQVSLQARLVTKEAQNGMSHCDIAFALAKMAYRNGSTDDISAYVLSLDVKGQGKLFEHAQVNVPCNGATLLADPVLAPQTPAQYKLVDGHIFRPSSHDNLDETSCTPVSGMHQHQYHVQ